MSTVTPAPAPTMAPFADVAVFARNLAFADLPAAVVSQAQRCLLDLIGVAAAGARTPAAAIASAYASTQLCGRDRDARILFDGRRAGLAGAAFAGASTIDAIDAHDGHPLTKGHAGVAVLPALLAFIDGDVTARAQCDSREFVTCIVLGYEIATRAGIALHATVTDYHCSGAWNALAAAALGGRLLRFDENRLRHALGIAEYFGPRGQILRVCAHPTMLKDGSGWGAHVGVSAVLLAQQGFTGAPAVTTELDDERELWSDLGLRWRILEQYFKSYPVCRWAQPAIEAALSLQRAHRLAAEDIVEVGVESFREAIDLGSQCVYPTTTDEAQYSLTYPLAAALVYGRVGAGEVDAATLGDARVKRLVGLVRLSEDPEFSHRFPAERFARVRIALRDGRTLVSEPTLARGNLENPLTDDEMRVKYRDLAGPVLGDVRASRIEDAVGTLRREPAAVQPLIEDLLTPID
ncbi:MAG: MmgE/PrpD family protein [Pseudomonadota bacterium]|nr:MmgE/PrpD family protein [Pseudomonadota bacterium]